MLQRIRTEPALVVALVVALLGLGAAFGLPLSGDQADAVVGTVTAVLALLGGVVTRSLVTPTVKTPTLDPAPFDVLDDPAEGSTRLGVLAVVALGVIALMAVPLGVTVAGPASAATTCVTNPRAGVVQECTEAWADTSSWDAVSGSWAGNGEVQNYRPTGQHSVGAGRLTISADRQSDGTWHSARLHSKAKIGGAFTLKTRAILPSGQGLWPAFWLLDVAAAGSSTDYWPLCGEIDIMEAVNAATSAHVNVHSGRLTPTPLHFQKPKSVAITPGVSHEYAVTVDPFAADPYVAFRIDGVTIHTVRRSQAPTGAWPFTPSRTYNVILNLAVGSSGPWPGMPNAATPAHAELVFGTLYFTQTRAPSPA